jgi:hypothetical protein
MMTHNPAEDASPADVPFGSNEMRLQPRQWLILMVLLFLMPGVADWVEPLGAGPDDRIPHRLGNDYWMARRYVRHACSEDRTLVIGDSVIWGHYVGNDETLSHNLNELAGDDRFANLGVDGIHPVALEGLIKHYGTGISGKQVILSCNLLWTADKRRDLQSKKEFSFNHPELVPQFSYKIPCYREPFLGRVGIVIRRQVPLLGWVRHLQIAYFDNRGVPAWSVEHPYENPVNLRLPSPDDPPSPPPVAQPWTTRKDISPVNFPWVELETSLQWRSFRRTIEILQKRGNRVFVVLGPFNEHMLTEESLEVYEKRKREAEAWLREAQIPYVIPAALPSDLYADASHPLAEGYRLLAERLFEDRSFVRFRAAAD